MKAASAGRPPDAAGAAVRVPVTTPAGALSNARWDTGVAALGGHLLQSSRWGEFKRRHGWDIERVTTGLPGQRGFAQLLMKRRGPFAVGYVPRGPALPAQGDVASALFSHLDEVCRRNRVVSLIVEPDQALPFLGRFGDHGFVRGPHHVQPSRTVKVPLLDDDALLQQMHQKTRYNVRLAERRGVVVERPAITAETMGIFYQLLQDTSERNSFGIHSCEYYADFMRCFGDDAVLLLARVDGAPAAALIAARFGSEAIYMYGASSTRNRAHGAAFYLQFAAMRWARESGCGTYDLWGIPAADPTATASPPDRVAATRGDDWRGLYRFKTGFGGTIVAYPPTLERRYHGALSWLARRVYAGRG